MTEHPRPWRYLPARLSKHHEPGTVMAGSCIEDANGDEVVAWVSDAAGQLIVDLANADEVQRTTGRYAEPTINGWRARDRIGNVPDMAMLDWFGYDINPTPHEAILAAHAWLQAREAKGGG